MFTNLFSGLDPNAFDEFRRLETEMDQILGRWAWPAGIRAVRRGTFPPINVGVTPDRVDVYVFAGGLDPKTLDISIQQNLLAVSGSRKLEVDETADYYRRERFDGDFRRVITLPETSTQSGSMRSIATACSRSPSSVARRHSRGRSQ